ncbi:MAG: sarcosine oxidase subunit gamma family protein [Xanthobacteraceae bacterium]
MSESRLIAVPSLAALDFHDNVAAGMAGVIITEQTNVSICSVLAHKGAGAQLEQIVRKRFDLALPTAPHYAASNAVAFIWAGQSQWLALKEGYDNGAFAQSLRSELGSAASVMDQSDGRTILRISGPRARDALAKGILIDLHPSAFAPGDTAITTVAYIGVHFWQIDAAPTYEFAVFRSFAIAFAEWAIDAAAEFGVTALK